jgi:hypothetical protein
MTTPIGGPGRDTVEERLRRAMTGVARRPEPAPAPVREILRASRTRRARRRTVALSAAAVLTICLALPLARLAAGRPPQTVNVPPAVTTSPTAHPTATAHPTSGPVPTRVGSGTIDGIAWSVTLEYYDTIPKDFADQYRGPLPPGDSVLCQRVVIGGVQVDAQGGQWADCDLVEAATPEISAGLAGNTDKGTSGDRVFVGHPGAHVTRARVVLSTGEQRTAQVVIVPGTGQRAYAVALGPSETIARVDDYDASGHLLGSTPYGP